MSDDISHNEAMKILDILYDMTHELLWYGKGHAREWYKENRNEGLDRLSAVKQIWDSTMEEYFENVLDMVMKGTWEDDADYARGSG